MSDNKFLKSKIKVNGQSKAQYLFGNISLLTIATFLPKALMFFMLPLYTRYLGTDDYGTADLVNTTVSLLLPIFTLQVQDAVLRFAIKREYSMQDIFTVAFRISFIGGLILVGGVVGARTFSLFSIDNRIAIFLCINYFTGSLNNISAYFLRGIDKVQAITVGSILEAIITVICNLLFLIVFRWGLYGYLIANSIGAIVKITYYFMKAKLYAYIKRYISNEYITKEMIKISIPMIFSALAWWINNASDKYFLRYYCNLSVVGVYAAASKIPSVLVSFGDVIAKAYSISAIKEFDKNDTDGFLGESYETISFAMIAICSALMIGNVFLAKFLFAKDFYDAWIYVPPLLMSVMINQFSESCTNIILAVGKTTLISYGAVAGAIVNTICNFGFIPHWGGYGAAIATVIGFFVAWQIKYHGMQRYAHIKHNVMKEAVAVLLLVIQMILAYWGNAYLVLEMLILGSIMFIYRTKLISLVKLIQRQLM